jgi:SAM-dependent methyltransferase
VSDAGSVGGSRGGAVAYLRLAEVYDEIVVDPCYGHWASYLRKLWETDATGVKTVLDLCCGTGLMGVELEALGYRVSGVDSSRPMLDRARRRLGPEAVLAECRLPDLSIDGRFDAAISTFDALNYLTPEEFCSTLAVVANRLRPGGWLIFDLHTDAAMEFAASHPTVEGKREGHHYVIDNIVDTWSRTCDSRIRVTRLTDGDTFSEHHRQYFFSEDDVRESLRRTGFELVSTTAEYSDQPVDSFTLRATWNGRLV